MTKTLFKLLLFLGMASLAFGQAALTTTSLSAAATVSGTTITVASATGITGPSSSTGAIMLFIDDGTGGVAPGEAMLVTAVNGTSISVVRGANGTASSPHISGAIVFAAPPNQFYQVEPSGACTAANTLVTPYINIRTGNQWLCSTVSNSWVPGFFNASAVPGVTTAVASAAGATNPSGPLFHVSGTNAITAWGSTTAVGLAGGGGSATSTIGAPFCIIPDAAYTTTATNNIAVATTGVVNKVQCWTFDQTNKKYVSSY